MREQDVLETWIVHRGHVKCICKSIFTYHVKCAYENMPMESHTYVECRILKTKYYLRLFHKGMILLIFFRNFDYSLFKIFKIYFLF